MSFQKSLSESGGQNVPWVEKARRSCLRAGAKAPGWKTGERKTHPIIKNSLAERRFEHSPFNLVVKGGHMKTMLPIHIDEQASNKERSCAGSLAIRSAAPLGTPRVGKEVCLQRTKDRSILRLSRAARLCGFSFNMPTQLEDMADPPKRPYPNVGLVGQFAWRFSLWV